MGMLATAIAPLDPVAPVPYSEVLGALSRALDLTEGQPIGHTMRACLVGMRLGRELGLGDAELSALHYALLLKDALRTNPHGGLEFGPGARAILKGEAELELLLPPKRERRRRRGGSAGANPIGDPLFEALRARRRELAEEASVPPYVIFHDSVLRDMASLRPATLGALSRISGIGARKLDAYGDAFLQVIREAA